MTHVNPGTEQAPFPGLDINLAVGQGALPLQNRKLIRQNRLKIRHRLVIFLRCSRCRPSLLDRYAESFHHRFHHFRVFVLKVGLFSGIML